MGMVYWALLFLLLIYIPIYIYVLKNRDKNGSVLPYGPTIMIRTKLGMRLIERYSKYHRFWRAFGTFSLIVSFVLMVMMIYIIATCVIRLPSSLTSGGIGIEYALAIPGLNPMLPLAFGIIGLIVAVCLHELAHGMQTASNGMRVDSTGALYCVIPVGAFVEPNEEDVSKADRTSRLHLYSAGIATNFVIAVVAFLIFSCGMLGAVSSPYEDDGAVYGITTDSPAYGYIPAGAIITSINGEDIDGILTDYDGIENRFSWSPGDVVTVSYITENGEGQADICWGVYAERVVEDSPASKIGMAKGDFLISIDDDRLYTNTEFTSFMSSTVNGQEVKVAYLDSSDSTIVIKTVELSSKGDYGFFGIATTTSGMSIVSPNEVLQIGRNPFYGDETLSDYGMSMLSYISMPLSGFSPIPEDVQWWFDVPADDLYWFTVHVMYWIFWLNAVLGISNAIPARPFDGGLIMEGFIDWVLERRGIRDREERENKVFEISKNISNVVLFLFLIVVIAVII